MDGAQSQSERFRVSSAVSEREGEKKMGGGRAPLQQVDVSMVPCGSKAGRSSEPERGVGRGREAGERDVRETARDKKREDRVIIRVVLSFVLLLLLALVCSLGLVGGCV